MATLLIQPIAYISSTLISINYSHYLLSLPFHSLYWLWNTIVLFPLNIATTILAVVFSPILHVLSYVTSCLTAVRWMVIAFEPLYSFFGVAAFVGTITGVILATSSSFITSHLGMNTIEQPRDYHIARRRVGADSSSSGNTGGGSGPSSAEEEEEDWQWTDTSSATRSRPIVTGLLSQTILEEDDSSEDL